MCLCFSKGLHQKSKRFQKEGARPKVYGMVPVVTPSEKNEVISTTVAILPNHTLRCFTVCPGLEKLGIMVASTLLIVLGSLVDEQTYKQTTFIYFR